MVARTLPHGSFAKALPPPSPYTHTHKLALHLYSPPAHMHRTAALLPTELHPLLLAQVKGNYAVAVTWTDGHTSSIYPYDTLKDYFLEDKPPAADE